MFLVHKNVQRVAKEVQSNSSQNTEDHFHCLKERFDSAINANEIKLISSRDAQSSYFS